MSLRSRSWPAYKTLLQKSTRPIILGPWRGEVGFESLYWVPFIHGLKLDPSRLYVITRGGAHIWYPNPRGCELLTLRDPRAVRVENIQQVKRTGKLKQETVSDFDQSVIEDAAEEIGLKHYHVLHPSWMYHVLEPYWNGERGLTWLNQHLGIQSLPPLELSVKVDLPANFVAVRFYARSTFPHDEIGHTVATETIKQLAAQQPVVLLNTPVHVDEHIDFQVKPMPNVYQLKDLVEMTPQNNLAVLSAVLSKAVGFVGTYGGLAQLALRYRKPTVSFYVDWQGTMLAHKYLADALAVQSGVACQVVRVTDVPLLRFVLPAVTFVAQSSKTSTGVLEGATATAHSGASAG